MSIDRTAVNRYGTLAARVYHADKPIGRSFGDVELYRDLLAGTTGPVLEPAVGNGRVLIPLLEAGLDVVGTDPSAEMLAHCRAECRARGLEPELRSGHFESPEEPGRYAAVIIPAGSVQLILDPAESRRALEGFARSLRPGGRLLLDLDSLHALAETAPSARSWTDGPEILTLSALPESVDVVAQRIRTQLRYELWRDGECRQSALEFFELRLWGVHEMVLALNAAGFDRVDVHADYRRDAVPGADTRVVTLEAFRRA